MLRIGFDAKRAYHNRTGLGNYARTFLNNLTRFFPQNQYHLFTPASSGGKLHHHPFPALESNQSPIRLHEDHSIWANWNRSFGMVKPLLANEIQLFHGLSNEIPMDLGRLQGRVRSVVTVHDLIYRDIPSTYPIVDRWIYRFKSSRSLALADQVVAISEFTRQRILDYYPEYASKVQVILQPCSTHYYDDPPESSLPPLGEQPYWLWVGTVEERKNLEAVLQALRLNSPQDRLPLVVIGNINSAYADRCIRLAAQWGLQVHWNPKTGTPAVNSGTETLPDLRPWYRHAMGLVYPSQLEGFGLPAAEALLCRCPVITTRNSAMAEICGDQGLLVDSSLPKELQQAMNTLQWDTSLRAQFQNSGFQRARTLLDPLRLSAQWMELYEKVLKQAKR